MFAELLENIQKHLPPLLNPDGPEEQVPDDEWRNKVDSCLALLSDCTLYFQSLTESMLGSTLFQDLNVEFMSRRSEIEFLKARFTHKSVKGIEMSVTFYRPFLNKGTLEAPSLSVDLEIFEPSGIEAFKSLYMKYRKIIDSVLIKRKLQFIYSFSYYEPEIFSGKGILKQLDKYFSDDNYNDKRFVFTHMFYSGVKDEAVSNTFLVLFVLFENCIGNLLKLEQNEKILQCFHKLSLA